MATAMRTRANTLARWQAAIKWALEEGPTPAVVRVAELPCHNCQGHGWGYGTVAGGHLDRVTCWTCDGSGVEPATLAA
ncbi:MAG: hypothetical protein H0W06_12695 [Chloroflexia bacterium]|nr:hypothetical protein [Chloroflexia bacterium]